MVWDIDKDADDWVKVWREHPKRAVRAVWTPEIHYIKNNYYICFSMCPSGIGILKSSTGKPEGPYVNAFDMKGSIADGIDPTLFQDDDGKVYFTYGAAKEIVQLKDDLSGFAGSFKKIEFTTITILILPTMHLIVKPEECTILVTKGLFFSKETENIILGLLIIMRDDIPHA